MTLTKMRDRVRFLLGELSSTNYSDANINTSINVWQEKGIVVAIQNSGDWEVSGEIATTNILNGQPDYAFPTDLVSIKRIEVNLTGGANDWQLAKIIDNSQKTIAISNTNPLANEVEIDLYDNSIRFLVTPTANSTAGLKIWYSDNATELSGDSDQSDLYKGGHDYMVYGACMDYCTARSLGDDESRFQKKLMLEEAKLANYYSNRKPIKRPRLEMASNRYE